MWRFEYKTLSMIRLALTSARTRVESELATLRSFSSFKAVGPTLYIAYLRDAEPGPFPVTAPYEWPRADQESLRVVMDVAFSSPAAQALYAHYRLSAKTPQGHYLSPAGRVDLLLGRRVASALPEAYYTTHPSPAPETLTPVLFYEDSEEES